MPLGSKTFHDNAQINVFLIIISLVILVFYNSIRFRSDTFVNDVIFIVRMVITEGKECNSNRISVELPMNFNILYIYMVSKFEHYYDDKHIERKFCVRAEVE